MANTDQTSPIMDRMVPGSSRIARRLVFSLVLVSSLVTLFITVFQLTVEYQEDISTVNNQIDQIRQVHIESVVYSVWTFDDEHISAQLDGFVRFPDLEYVGITIDGQTAWEAGRQISDQVIREDILLIREQEGEKIELGYMTVIASLDSIYNRLFQEAIILLLSNGVKTAIVVFFTFFVFRNLVTIHLVKLSALTRELGEDILPQDIKLDRTPPENGETDELDDMVVGLQHMVTRLRGSAENERQVKDQLRTILDNTSAMVHAKDIKGHFTLVNKRFCAIRGLSQSEILGRTESEVSSPELAGVVLSHDQEVLTSGRPLQFEETGNYGGEEHTFLSVKVPLRGPDGRVEGLCCISTDITQRKRYEEELRAYRDELEDMVQKRTEQLESEVKERRNAQAKLLNVNENLEKRVAERTKALADEISERRRAETDALAARDQALLANRAKSEFLANMSHELRTPLNAIIGFAELLEQQLFGPFGDDRYGEYVGDIRESGEHLLQLINDLLDVSRIEIGAVELIEGTIDVEDLVDTCLRTVSERARLAEVDLQSDIPEGLPELYGDERRIKQVLINLLTNAIKFTNPSGMVKIIAQRMEDGCLCFRVSDTGIGIAKKDIPLILEKFAQVDSGLERANEGAGLGLPLSKSLMELHEGTLTIDSRVGMGTAVTITFPSDRCED